MKVKSANETSVRSQLMYTLKRYSILEIKLVIDNLLLCV